MANDFGRAEPDAICPVPLDKLGSLYRSDPEDLMSQIRDMPEDRRITLAVFCYQRAHLRDLGLSIAATCSDGKLVEAAGVVGQALSIQCRASVRRFGQDAPARPTGKPKISLGGNSRT